MIYGGGPVTVLDILVRSGSNIDQRAKTYSPRQVALFLVAIIPLVIGFVIFWIWKAAWTVASWVWASGVEGWEIAKAASRKDQE